MSPPSQPSEADVRAADWILGELGRPFPLRALLRAGAVCATSLALWCALIWALVAAV